MTLQSEDNEDHDSTAMELLIRALTSEEAMHFAIGVAEQVMTHWGNQEKYKRAREIVALVAGGARGAELHEACWEMRASMCEVDRVLECAFGLVLTATHNETYNWQSGAIWTANVAADAAETDKGGRAVERYAQLIRLGRIIHHRNKVREGE